MRKLSANEIKLSYPAGIMIKRNRANIHCLIKDVNSSKYTGLSAHSEYT